MEVEPSVFQYISTAIIGAVIGAIFGGSGLLFFPLRKYMEKKFKKAEDEAQERNKYQKELYIISGEERSATNKYLFWLKETTISILDECACGKDRGIYFSTHINEASKELLEKESKRKEIEKQQLADYNLESK